jgi:signal transduction histidine kinase
MDKGATPLRADTNTLASYLQAESEREKFSLVRQLHDVLGGLMVASLMDLDWIERHLGDATQAQAKLHHIRQSLTAAIDLKRELIENLRPTLLDNFGLFAALKWYLEHFCKAAGLQCCVALGLQEPQLPEDAAISVFRFVQETLQLSVRRSSPTPIGIDGQISCSRLTLQLSHDGRSMPHDAEPEFASMAHRISRLGGVLNVMPKFAGGLCWSAEIPMQANP